MPPTSIAILGGGITGLSAAFHLSRRFPTSRITLLEKQERLGGWIRSKRIAVPIPGGDVGSTLLEFGPRTLRPRSKALLELVNLLDLSPHLIATPINTPAAKHRFLYLPDAHKPGLTAIPSSALGYFTSRLSLIMIPSVLREPFRRANRPTASEEDESLDALMTRRFGPEFARILGSSLVHGIYAADSRKLSVRAAFPPVRDAEIRGSGSIIRGLLKSRQMASPENSEIYETGDLEKNMSNISVYSFRDGLEVLTNALRRNLEKAPNVEIRTGATVSRIDFADGSPRVSTPSGVFHSSHLVSTIPLPTLDTLVSGSKPPYLAFNPTSSVTIASFIFAAASTRIHPEGFGYLIPRPKDGYGSSANPEGILGVVFDSCSVGAQDQPRGSLTKLTMMLGGPYPRFTADPSEMGPILLNALQRHLGRHLPPPVFFEVTHNADCIPSLAPGHMQRIKELRQTLQENPWHGRMEVIGAGVGGVSLGDCVEQGRNVGGNWV